MGLAVGDHDNDGRVDFHITNFSDDSNVLYRNDGDANFTDVTFQAGLGEPTIPFLGWGTAFIDYNNDGWRDLIVANGHVYPAVDDFQWGTSFAQQILLFKNTKLRPNGQVRFDRVPAAPKSGLSEAYSARGLALADLDGDGRLDVITANIDSTPTVLKNVSDTRNHWLKIKLIGDTSKKTPKDAVGSKVFVTTGKIRQRFDLISGASYASQSEQVVHVGLGEAVKVDKLEIIWANGQIETLPIDKLDTLIVVRQNEKR